MERIFNQESNKKWGRKGGREKEKG